MIPVFDVIRQNKILKKELDAAISSVIVSGVFILGPKVEEFEKAFAKYIGVKYSVGVASGTDAISLALLALGVGKGDEVIMPANSYPSVFAVAAVGAVPKLVDIDPATFNINPELIPDAITSKTKAILPVHLYGQAADMERILEISAKYKIPVVEDCAQAVGAEVSVIGSQSFKSPKSLKLLKYKTGWTKVGSIGDVGCFSFYPTKNLGCFGDGGMVVTDNREIYEKVKLLRMYGEKTRYNSIIAGKNSRLDELQAAVLLAKLKYLNKWNKKRREIALLYKSQISNLKSQNQNLNLKSTNHQPPTTNTRHVYHLFVIRSKKRDALKDYLEKKGIQTAVHYPVPIHLVPSMKYLGYKKGDFPQSEKACEEILSLPMFPELKDGEVTKVVEVIAQFYSG